MKDVEGDGVIVGVILYMAEPVVQVGGAVVIGEFCEVQGPVVRQLFCRQGTHGTLMQLDGCAWPPCLAKRLDELMVLSMSCDYNIASKAGEVCGGAVTHLILDPLRWDTGSAVAHVARVNIPDVFARGHQRALCVALICPVLHVSLALSRWMSDCCERIAHRLVHGAHRSYEEDVRRCQGALTLLLEAPDKATLLSPQTSRFLEQELQIMNLLHDKNQLIDVSTPPPQESEVSVSLTEAVELAERLIADRDPIPLRPLNVVCGACYTAAVEEVQMFLYYYSLDAPALMEGGALGTLPSAFQVIHSSFPNLLEDAAKKEWAADSPHSFNVGELPVLDPLQPDVNFPLSNCVPSTTHFTALYDAHLHSTLRTYGAQHVMEVAYNALRCKSIIVCGYDECSVVDAMKVACLFVPGLLQGRDHTLRLGIIPLNSSEVLTAEDIHRFAVVGCHVNAAMLHDTPRFAQACTWYVGRQERNRGCCTIKLYGESYDLSSTTGHYPSLSVLSSPSPVEADTAARRATPMWLSSLPQSLTEMEESTRGLLCELADILRQKPATTTQEAALSDYVRLVLKRLLFDYCSYASLLLQHHLQSCCQTHPLATTLDAPPPPCFSLLGESSAQVNGDTLPWVWSDVDTELTLRTCFGIRLPARGDVIIVTELMKRMTIVVAWKLLQKPEGTCRQGA